VQLDYNEANGITPQGVQKAIRDDLISAMLADARAELAPSTLTKGKPKPEDLPKMLEHLETEMKAAAAALDFERAAQLVTSAPVACSRAAAKTSVAKSCCGPLNACSHTLYCVACTAYTQHCELEEDRERGIKCCSKKSCFNIGYCHNTPLNAWSGKLF
jgi:choline dehydrogenase-like flavoprotein